MKMNQTAETQMILKQISRVVICPPQTLELALAAILSGGHVLLEDTPGTGKTTLALSFARVLGLDFHRIQMTIDTLPGDITGFSTYDQSSGRLRFVPGAVQCQLLLADEINRTSSRTQAALLQAMAEKQITVDGVPHALPDPFICIATQNPAGSAGTSPLPLSELDRFALRLSMGYPDLESQIRILKDRRTGDPLNDLQPVMTAQALLTLQSQVRALPVDDRIYRYIAQLGEATRQCTDLRTGLSPRALLSLTRLSQALAFIQGRDYVVPEDVQALFLPACAHRVVPLSFQSSREPEEILLRCLKAVAAPSLR